MTQDARDVHNTLHPTATSHPPTQTTTHSKPSSLWAAIQQRLAHWSPSKARDLLHDAALVGRHLHWWPLVVLAVLSVGEAVVVAQGMCEGGCYEGKYGWMCGIRRIFWGYSICTQTTHAQHSMIQHTHMYPPYTLPPTHNTHPPPTHKPSHTHTVGRVAGAFYEMLVDHNTATLPHVFAWAALLYTAESIIASMTDWWSERTALGWRVRLTDAVQCCYCARVGTPGGWAAVHGGAGSGSVVGLVGEVAGGVGGVGHEGVDNPDQRMTQDVALFCSMLGDIAKVWFLGRMLGYCKGFVMRGML